MITPITNYKSRLAIIHNIPKTFFRKIDESVAFGDHLFPNWSIAVFQATDMQLKFRAVYNDYKALATNVERKQVLDAFSNTNKVKELCENEAGIQIHTLNSIPVPIRDSIKELFNYLYNSSLEYHQFEKYAQTTVKESIDNYLHLNRILVCPFCGIETYLNLEGQARLPLDHWLDKATFPFSSVNQKNLIPIGSICNGPGVKHNKNILLDGQVRRHDKAYYPFLKNLNIRVSFRFIIEPSSKIIPDADWIVEIIPEQGEDNIYIESWDWIMNLRSRYRSYFRKEIFPLWESTYQEYIEDPDSGLIHANNIDEFMHNLRQWKSTFKIKIQPGAILYRAFIDYLLNYASQRYLYGLYNVLKR